MEVRSLVRNGTFSRSGSNPNHTDGPSCIDHNVGRPIDIRTCEADFDSRSSNQVCCVGNRIGSIYLPVPDKGTVRDAFYLRGYFSFISYTPIRQLDVAVLVVVVDSLAYSIERNP